MLSMRSEITDWPAFWVEARAIATAALIALRNAIRSYQPSDPEVEETLA